MAKLLKWILFFLLLTIWAPLSIAHRKDITTFEEFKEVFNKKYSSRGEERCRKGVFLKTLEFIKENNGTDGVTYAVNQLADKWSWEVGGDPRRTEPSTTTGDPPEGI